MDEFGANNTTGNDVGPSTVAPPGEHEDHFHLLEMLEAYLNLTILLIAMVLNVFIMTAFLRDKRLQAIFNYYMFHLSIADTSYSFTVIINILHSWLHIFHLYNTYLCVMVAFIDVTVTLEQLILLLLMTSDRYSAVTRGLVYKQKQRARQRSQLDLVERYAGRSSREHHDALGKIGSMSTSAPSYSLPSISTTLTNASDTRGVMPNVRRTRIFPARERAKVLLSWVFSAVIGFFIADVGTLIYKDKDDCTFPIRFLYIHYTAFAHAVLLTCLFLYFLVIVREYRRQKRKSLIGKRRGLCCSCLRRPKEEILPYNLSVDIPRASSSVMQPRSPDNSRRMSCVKDSNVWFNAISEDDVFFDSSVALQTSIDNMHTYAYYTGSKAYSNKQHNHNVSERSGAASMVAVPEIRHRPVLNTPAMSFLSEWNPDKEALLPSRKRRLDVKTPPSPRAKAGKMSLSLEKRLLRHISGHVILLEEQEEAEAVSNLANVESDIDLEPEEEQCCTLEKAKSVGLEFTESGLETHFLDTYCNVAGEYNGYFIDTFSSVCDREAHSFDRFSPFYEQGARPIDAFGFPECSPLRECMVTTNDTRISIIESQDGACNEESVSPSNATVTANMLEENALVVGGLDITDRKGKAELRKSARIFNSIDKYCIQPTDKKSIADKRKEKRVAISQNNVDGQEIPSGIRFEEDTEPLGNVSDSTAPVLPVVSFSDDELTEIPVTTFNKVRTDSLYTLRSCLSIQEDNESSSLVKVVRDTSPSIITGNISDTVLTLGAPTTSSSRTEDNLFGGSGGIEGASQKHQRKDSTKSALFTIGDGNEDTEHDVLEREWQGWDNLFGCSLRRNDDKDCSCSVTSLSMDIKTHDSDFSFLKLEAESLVERTSTSDEQDRETIRYQQFASDSPKRQLMATAIHSVKGNKGQPYVPVDKNVNQSDPPEQESSNDSKYKKGTGEPSEEGDDTDAASSLAEDSMRSAALATPSSLVENFNHVGKKRAARYKLMLKDWTFQGHNAEKNKYSLGTDSGQGAAVSTSLEFYQGHCDPGPGAATNVGCNLAAVSGTLSQRHLTRPGGSSEGDLYGSVDQKDGASFNGAPLIPAQIRVEVEEDADTEDGLLNSQKKSEIDEAVGQWLKFYEVSQPLVVHSSQCSMPLSSEFPDSFDLEGAIPKLEAVGDVTQGDLLKARQIWFQFYDVKTQLSSQGTSPCTPFSDRSEDASRSRLLSASNRKQLTDFVDSESPVVSRNALCTDSKDTAVITMYENSPCCSLDSNTPGVPKRGLGKTNYAGVREGKNAVDTQTNFSSQLCAKLTALSYGFPRDVCEFGTREKETGRLRHIEGMEKESASDIRRQSACDRVGVRQKSSNLSVRSPSFDELTPHQGDRPLEFVPSAYPFLTSSDNDACESLTSPMDRIDSQRDRVSDMAKQHQSTELRRQTHQPDMDEDLRCQETQRNRSVACREPTLSTQPVLDEGMSSSSRVAPTCVSACAASSSLDLQDIQACPPSSPASEEARPVNTRAEQPTHNGSATSNRVFSTASATADLASRLLESVSLKRRALLAELGLYQDILSGLYPLDWILARGASNAGNATRNVESDTRSAPTGDTELSEECPHCLRRARLQHAEMGRQVEATIRRLFGMRTPAFEEHCESASNIALENAADDSHAIERFDQEGMGIGLGPDGNTCMQCAQVCPCVGKLAQHAADDIAFEAHHKTEGHHTGTLEDYQERFGTAPPAFGENNNSNTNKAAASYGKNNNSSRPQSPPKNLVNVPNDQNQTSLNKQKVSDALTKLSKTKTAPKKTTCSCCKCGGFQSLLTTDPTLALVVSHGLILFAQFLSWWPRTALYIYYDLTDFPPVQSIHELLIISLFYTRVLLTPCVCLYYSKGYRENFAKILGFFRTVLCFWRRT
ncbi:hypothetical protein EGW08_018116 [Elysia chlorotica]|uniref:G-protein coupled receptors family 1 profile domain-containing protein n=1 Tax=Elysia chlorotica TaxID=188477 RepID=A0A3S1BSW9_ELYCH|nr:hypothetical protein EGW08_018116 [Elysia chlorotica]